MNAVVPIDLGKDINVIKLAREIAIDHYAIEDILQRYSITTEVWDQLQEWPRFIELVEIERANWNSATNTNARIKLKSSTLIEEWMEEGYKLLHSSGESFNAKIELLKLLGKFSGMDAPSQMQGEVAGRVTINIKIGDTELAFDGDGETIIDGEANEDGEEDGGENEENDPDVIDYDWSQEFEVNPTADADSFFENITPE